MRANWTKTVIAAAGLLVATVLAIVAVDLLGEGETAPPSIGPVVLSEDELREQVSELDRPVYWVGPRPDAEGYELTFDEAKGMVYVRYLTGLGKPSAAPSALVAITTLTVPDARRAMRESADTLRGEMKLSKHDGYEVLDDWTPQTRNIMAFDDLEHAFVAFDDEPQLKVEVYTSVSREAGKLIRAGALAPLD